jgi:dual specificity phosphatase 3
MTTPHFPLLSLDLPQRPVDPQFWWRKVCFVTPTLAMSGGISRNHDTAREQLARWEEAGITDYMPVHIEFNEQEFIEANSNIRVHHIGVNDDLGRRDPRWFDAIAEKADEIQLDPNAVLMVTCWVGCNRGPSATYAILRTRGWDSLPALRAIREARPIAATIYAPDAAAWWVARNGGDYNDMQLAVDEVRSWFRRNPLDAHWVIGSINGW